MRKRVLGKSRQLINYVVIVELVMVDLETEGEGEGEDGEGVEETFFGGQR